MKKDFFVVLLRKAGFIWREAKKPMLRIDTKGDITLLPCRNSNDDGNKPKICFKVKLDLTLVYVLLALVAFRAMLSFIFD